MEKKDRKLYDSWKYKSRNFMEFNNPVFQALLGLVIFYISRASPFLKKYYEKER